MVLTAVNITDSLPGCDNTWFDRLVPTSWTNLLPPTSGQKSLKVKGNKFLLNICAYVPDYMVSHCRKLLPCTCHYIVDS